MHGDNRATVFDELVRLGPPSGPADRGVPWHAFSPLVSWLVASTRPSLTVEWGPGDRTSLLATCDAVARVGDGARCVAARLVTPAPDGAERFADALLECTSCYPGLVAGHEAVGRGPGWPEGGEHPGLLHVSLFDIDGADLDPLPAWLAACAPGAVVVVTTTATGTCAAFDRAEQLVSSRYPSTRLPLGDVVGALVAQVPVGDATPAVDLLRSVPAAVGRYLEVLARPATGLADLGQVGDEPLSQQAVRAVIAGLLDRQDVERGALLAALGAYRAHTAGLTAELAEVRRSLVAQERLAEEFLDRLDELSAKVSTSAARFTAQLEEKDRLLEAEDRKVLAYAAQAADAHSIIDDMERSSSWRMTAPLRRLSLFLARRRATRAG